MIPSSKNRSSLSLLAALVAAIPLSLIAQQSPPAPVTTTVTTTTKPKPTPPPRTEASAVTPEIKGADRHAEFMFRKTQGDIGLLFMGDSIMDFWPRKGEWTWEKYAQYNVADFGISGDATEHVLWRITNGELDGIKPKVVILMIGTNNLGHSTDEKPEWVAAGVKKIVDTIHEKLPDTKVLLLAIFPRSAHASDPIRLQVDEVNKIIAKLDDGSKTRYLDIGPKFLDANGELTRAVMPDYLHPNAHGYDIWYEAMNPLLVEMMK